MTENQIKVLVIDDSAVIRKILSDELNQDPKIRVIATAINPVTAEHKIGRVDPDAIVLDLEMPQMDGLTFLKSLRKKSSIPVVVFSAHSEKDVDKRKKALSLGAFAVVQKPNGQPCSSKIKELAAKVKEAVTSRAFESNVREMDFQNGDRELGARNKNKVKQPHFGENSKNAKIISPKVIAIGASTGGTDAIREVLLKMPRNCPPIVLVIHMPKEFTYRFAERLNGICEIGVKEARDGDLLQPGLALLAPGNHHLILQKSNGGYRATLMDGLPVMRHRPSVEVLFQSVAEVVQSEALGILLTGMGADGAKGLNQIHRNGGYTIAQNEETCVVFGMPNEAIKMGGVDKVLALNQIPNWCVAWMNQSNKNKNFNVC